MESSTFFFISLFYNIAFVLYNLTPNNGYNVFFQYVYEESSILHDLMKFLISLLFIFFDIYS